MLHNLFIYSFSIKNSQLLVFQAKLYSAFDPPVYIFSIVLYKIHQWYLELPEKYKALTTPGHQTRRGCVRTRDQPLRHSPASDVSIPVLLYTQSRVLWCIIVHSQGTVTTLTDMSGSYLLKA